MKTIRLIILLFTLPILLSAQARTGISLSAGGLKPFADNWKGGKVISLNGDFRVSKKVAIKFGVGSSAVKEGVYNSLSNTWYYTGGMVFLTLQGKYFIHKNWFTNAGGLAYVAGDDGAYGGYGGTMSIGYRANVDEHFSLELSPVLNILKTSHTAGVVPVAGFVMSLYYSSGLKN